MKALSLLALLLNLNPAFAATSHSETAAPEAPALQVQVNDSAYIASVEAYFKARKTPIKIVRNITSDSYVQVSLNLDMSQGTNCKVFVVASNHGMYVQYPASGFVAKTNASHYCEKFLSESLSAALPMVF